MHPTVRTLTLMVLVSLAGLSSAQAPALGEWRIHLPYRNCISAVEAGSKIYAATPFNIFYYDRDDESINRITRVEGLSDLGVSAIAWESQLKTLIIAYSNANIDLLTEDGIINISDIKRKPIYGNKTINHILLHGNLAYLSCGFGIVVLDLVRHEIKDTYYIGPGGNNINVYGLAFDGSHFWAATELGIYKADAASQNLANFAEWIIETGLNCPTAKYNHIIYFSGKLFTSISRPGFAQDTVYFRDNNGWHYLDPSLNANVKSMRTSYDRLLISYNYNVYIYRPDTSTEEILWTYNPGTPEPVSAIFDKDGYLWVCDSKLGLVRFKNWISDYMSPNGPGGNDVFSFASSGNHIWVAPGGVGSSWINAWNTSGPYALIDDSWYVLRDQNPGLDSIFDVITLAIDPSDNNHVFAGSWKNGLLEFRNGQLINVYNENNSLLEQPYDYYSWLGIGGVCFDQSNNLWVVNSGSNALLKALTPTGNWVSFNLYPTLSQARASSVISTSNGYKWVLLTRFDGLLVFNDNGTLTNKNDDKAKVLTATPGNGALPSNNVLSIAEDHDGRVWIGTDKGVAVFYSPDNIFTANNFDAQVVTLVQDNTAQHLLEFESVTAIAVDGSNKKWFGTEKAGVFLMSEDGTEEILHFTTENSPLLSNTITGITINHKTGEVFFGTAGGVVSYRGIATEGGTEFSGVYAFPNPVREGYNGLIGITGMTTDAYVKITDISGNLVYETRAEGGQAAWNAKDLSGNRVKTGVYMVFCSSEDGSEKFATKILVIN